jgi:hypothetical protein
MKTCLRCRLEKTDDAFYANRKAKDGLASNCKPCQYEYTKEWEKTENARRIRANNRRATKYGISPNDYDYMLERQGYRCAICLTEEPGGSGGVFQVDHSHDTGFVRGLLCGSCNKAIGLLKEDPESLTRAILYLRRGK